MGRGADRDIDQDADKGVVNRSVTDSGKLQVICALPVYSLLRFEFSVVPNSHAAAEIKVMLADSDDIEDEKSRKDIAGLMEDIHGSSVSIVELDDEGACRYPSIYTGLIERCQISQEAGVRMAEIRAVSGSSLFDREKKFRSFQDIGLTYKELVRNVIRETPKAASLYFAAHKELGNPVIQYEETDYAFILRMASHQNTCLYPDITEPFPRIYYGLPEGENVGEIQVGYYKTGFLYSREKLSGGISREQQRYYEIKTGEDLSIGDTVIIKGRKLRVCMKKGILEKGLLYYTYTIADACLIWQARKVNPLIRGVSLQGTVLERKQESVKLHLDIDADQDQNKAYFFPWKPETGNIMYCMPEIGTKVRLYIGGREEYEAVAVDNIRYNGSSCQETQDTDWRYLSNEFGKVMKLHPEMLEFRAGNQAGQESKFQLMDDSGILFRSGQEISIKAREAIQFLGQTVTVSTPTEFVAVKRDLLSPTMIDICKNIDILGKKGKITSSKGSAVLPVIDSGEDGASKAASAVYQIDAIQEELLSSIPQAASEALDDEKGDMTGGMDCEIRAILTGSMMHRTYGRK